MTSRRVARSYYAITGLYTLSASIIWGANALSLLATGLDIFEVFICAAGGLPPIDGVGSQDREGVAALA